MDDQCYEVAYRVAADAGKAKRLDRRRWLKTQWERDNMRTESTRFTVEMDAELRRCCRQAGVTRYALIAYLLRAWMAAWKVYGER